MENVRWLIKQKYEKVRGPQGDWVSMSTQVKKVGHVTLILSVLAINNKILKYFVWPSPTPSQLTIICLWKNSE